jgi:hypothetical protein
MKILTNKPTLSTLSADWNVLASLGEHLAFRVFHLWRVPNGEQLGRQWGLPYWNSDSEFSSQLGCTGGVHAQDTHNLS